MTKAIDHPQRKENAAAETAAQPTDTRESKPLPHIEPAPLWLVQHTFDVIEQAECGLPKNVELERETLCGILVGDDQYTGIAFEQIEPRDFSNLVYRGIFSALKEGWESGVLFNTPALLLQWVRDSKLLERVGEVLNGEQIGIESLLQVMQSHGMAHNMSYYARLLRRLRVEREIWVLLMDAAIEAKEGKPYEWLDMYSRKLNELKDAFPDTDR